MLMRLNLQAIKPTAVMMGASVFSAEPRLPLKKTEKFVNVMKIVLFTELISSSSLFGSKNF